MCGKTPINRQKKKSLKHEHCNNYAIEECFSLFSAGNVCFHVLILRSYCNFTNKSSPKSFLLVKCAFTCRIARECVGNTIDFNINSS